MHFEKAHAVIMAGIAAAGLVVAFAGYRLNAEHERRQEQQQIDNMLKTSAPQPTTMLPNLDTKASDKPAEKEPEKRPDNPTSHPEQKAPETAPDETPKEPPKEAPKPFTFWGYFQTGQQLRPGIFFRLIHATWERAWSHAAWRPSAPNMTGRFTSTATQKS